MRGWGSGCWKDELPEVMLLGGLLWVGSRGAGMCCRDVCAGSLDCGSAAFSCCRRLSDRTNSRSWCLGFVIPNICKSGALTPDRAKSPMFFIPAPPSAGTYSLRPSLNRMTSVRGVMRLPGVRGSAGGGEAAFWPQASSATPTLPPYDPPVALPPIVLLPPMTGPVLGVPAGIQSSLTKLSSFVSWLGMLPKEVGGTLLVSTVEFSDSSIIWCICVCVGSDGRKEDVYVGW